MFLVFFDPHTAMSDDCIKLNNLDLYLKLEKACLAKALAVTQRHIGGLFALGNKKVLHNIPQWDIMRTHTNILCYTHNIITHTNILGYTHYIITHTNIYNTKRPLFLTIVQKKAMNMT